MHPSSALIRSQCAGHVFVDSVDRNTKWEWKLRIYSVNLQFSADNVVGVKKSRRRERWQTIADTIVAVIDYS